MKPPVFVAMPLPPQHLDALKQHCDVEVFGGKQPIGTPELIASLAGAEGVLGSAQLRFPTEVLDGAPRLRAICNVGVGYDNVDLAELNRRGITIANTPGVLSDAVADLVIGLMIAVARRLRECEAIVREGRWGRPDGRLQLGTDLRAKTLAIVGMGRIGREVAARALACKMRVVCYDTRHALEIPSSVERLATLDETLAAADFVSLHTDLNPGTRHLIGARELALMKPAAFLINAARGAVVDQKALYDALNEKRIAGAGLDVLEAEPPDAGDPLLRLDNVFIVPHIGSATVETRAAMLDLAIGNLIACVTGQPCANIVNPEALASR
jgi:lactate dehydrogenase-like 2-hydroxyacid dehydrogenase